MSDFDASDYRNLHRRLNAGGTLWGVQSPSATNNQGTFTSTYSHRYENTGRAAGKRLAAELRACETELKQARVHKTHLERECDSLQERLQKKQTALSDADANIQQLDTKIRDLRQKNAPLIRQSDALADNFRTLDKPIAADFSPSQETLEYLVHFKQIALDYIQGKIPDFRLYWLERGDARPNWQSVFRQRLEYLWQREALRVGVQPDFTPSPATLEELMKQDHIPVDFAISVTGAFISYFAELKYQTIAWQALFKQYVRQQWNAQQHETQQTNRRSAIERLTDTSWSDAIRFNTGEDE